MKRWSYIPLAGLLVAGAAGWFLLSTVLLDEVPDGVLVAACALTALLLVLALGLPSRSELASIGKQELLMAATAGVLMLVIAPLVVLANRFTDAPPGSETLFLTTAAWSALALAAGAFVAGQRANLLQIALVSTGVVGAAALLASWERPSSFSPFVRYPKQDLAFLVAGVLWLLGALLLVRLRKHAPAHSGRAVLVVASAAASIVGLGWGLIAGGVPQLGLILDRLGVLLAAGGLFATVFVCWWLLSATERVATVGSLLLMAPAVITGFGAFEQAFSPRGPDPIVWPGALAGMTLAVCGSVGAWWVRRAATNTTTHTPRSASLTAALAVSGLATLTAAASLVMPAIAASATGTLANGEAYSANWSLLGYETAGGWLALVAGGLLLTTSVDSLREQSARRIVGMVAVAAVAMGAYVPAASTPLHTWNRWVPVEVQTEYGTEYALLQFTAVHQPVRLAALALAALSAALLLIVAVAAVMSSRKAHASSEVS